MPCLYFDVKIIQRSKRQSAPRSAACQSGERLFSEYGQKQKYGSRKSEIVHTEILLSPYAPPEYGALKFKKTREPYAVRVRERETLFGKPTCQKLPFVCIMVRILQDMEE